MKKTFMLLIAPLLALFSLGAQAAPVDLTPLTSQIDFSTTITAIMAAAGMLMAVYIVWRAAKFVIHVVKGG